MVVSKGNVAEDHRPPGTRQRASIRALRYSRGFIQQRERPFGPGQVILQAGGLFADRLQGPVELREVAPHQHKTAQRQRPGLDSAHANEHHRRHARRRDQRHQQAVSALRKHQPQPRPHSFVGFVHETGFLPVFLAERLDHPGGTQNLLHHRQSRTLHFFDLARLAAQPPSIRPRYQKNGGRNRQSHDGQLPIDPRGHVDHRQKSNRRGDKRDDSLDDDVLNGGRVVLNPVGGIGRAFAVVVGKRELLHVAEQLRAKGAQQFFSGVRGQQRVDEVAELRQQGDGDQQSDRQRQNAGGRLRHRLGQPEVEERRQRAIVHHVVHGDFQGQRTEQGKGR